MTIDLNFQSALVVVAHPDDEVLGCGGLISKYADVIDFHVLFIAEGSSCRYDDPNCDASIEAQRLGHVMLKRH